MSRIAQPGPGDPKPMRLQVAAVGAATAAAAREAGWNVAVVPGTYVAESLVAALAGEVAGKRVLLARAEVARDVIPEALRAAGAVVDVVDAYRNVVPEAAPEHAAPGFGGWTGCGDIYQFFERDAPG